MHHSPLKIRFAAFAAVSVAWAALTVPAAAQCGTAIQSEVLEHADVPFRYGAQFGVATTSWVAPDGAFKHAVGVPGANRVGVIGDGKVLVYRKGPLTTDTWQLDDTVLPPASVVSWTFGKALAYVRNGTSEELFVSADDHVLVMRKIGAVWSVTTTINSESEGAHASRIVWVPGANRVVIADPYFSVTTNPQQLQVGRAWVYRPAGSTWVLEHTIEPPITGSDHRFGIALAASGNEFAIGEFPIDGTPLSVKVLTYRLLPNGAGTTVEPRSTLSPIHVDRDQQTYAMSLAMNVVDNTLVVGLPSSSSSNSYNAGGTVRVYERGSANELWQTTGYTVLTGPTTQWTSFGASVALTVLPNGQSERLAIGAPGRRAFVDGNSIFVGSVDVYEKTVGGWSHERTIRPLSGSEYQYENSRFGSKMSAVGQEIVVGAPLADTPEAIEVGSVSAYTLSDSSVPVATTLYEEQLNVNPRYGSSVAISGNRMVAAGPYGDTSGGLGSGFVNVYTRNGASWLLTHTIIPGMDTYSIDQWAGEHSGIAVDIEGDYLIVSSRDADMYDAQFNYAVDCGRVYVYHFENNEWVQVQELAAPDRAAGDLFGASLDLRGAHLIVGASYDDNSNGVDAGSAYIFSRDAAGVFQYVTRIQASDGSPSDRFGVSVALGVVGTTIPPVSQTVAAVGAFAHDLPGSNAGAVYTFRRNSQVGGVFWDQMAKLSAGTTGDNFGYRVAISGNTLAASLLLDDVAGATDAGAVQLYTSTNGATWTAGQNLVAPAGEANEWFGSDIDMIGSDLLIGAQQENNTGGTAAGAAYLYRNVGGTFTLQQTLRASDRGAGDLFGTSVAVSGSTIVVGAPFNTTAVGASAGTVYAFDLNNGVPTINTQPASVSMCTVGTATFEAVVSGSGPMTFQWQYESAPNVFSAIPPGGVIPGVGTVLNATGVVLQVSNLTLGATARFRVFISNACGNVMSDPATLTVNSDSPPTVSIALSGTPVGVPLVCPGSFRTLVATATGTPPFSYRWYRDGSVIRGASSSTFDVQHDAVYYDTDRYVCRVFDACSTALSNGIDMFGSVTSLSILGESNRAFCAGEAVVLESAFAAGEIGNPFSFQWRKDGVVLPGQNLWTLNFDHITSSDAGEYVLSLTHPCGTLSSAPISIVVNSGGACPPIPCDSIDFNRDELFPDTDDILTFIAVFAGAGCPTGTCGDIDFNNDGLFPDTADIEAFIRVFGGGSCEG